MYLRFQRLTTLYPQFARQFLAANADWRELSYEGLLDRLLEMRFAESNYHAYHLARYGHATETQFISFEPLQRKWLAEHGDDSVSASELQADWTTAIAMAQVRAFQPDILWLDDLYWMDAAFRERLRQVVKPTTLLVGWRAAPTDDYASFRDLDLVLTSIRGLAEQFRAAGVPVELLHHSFEVGILDSCPPPDVRDIPFSFAGQIGSLHPQRARLVEMLLEQSPLEVWGAEWPSRTRDRLHMWLARHGISWGRKGHLWRLLARHGAKLHESCFGRDYYQILGRSQLVFNSHISCSSQDASNMRLFEATGMGACLITDWKPNLKDLFEPDVEVATYRSSEECVEKVTYLLQHPAVRESIAAAGQKRTLQDHTYSRRMKKLETILTERFDDSCRRARAA